METKRETRKRLGGSCIELKSDAMASAHLDSRHTFSTWSTRLILHNKNQALGCCVLFVLPPVRIKGRSVILNGGHDVFSGEWLEGTQMVL